MDIINKARLKVWQRQGPEFVEKRLLVALVRSRPPASWLLDGVGKGLVRRRGGDNYA